jgi:hypothetical protein
MKSDILMRFDLPSGEARVLPVPNTPSFLREGKISFGK